MVAVVGTVTAQRMGIPIFVAVAFDKMEAWDAFKNFAIVVARVIVASARCTIECVLIVGTIWRRLLWDAGFLVVLLVVRSISRILRIATSTGHVGLGLSSALVGVSGARHLHTKDGLNVAVGVAVIAMECNLLPIRVVIPKGTSTSRMMKLGVSDVAQV